MNVPAASAHLATLGYTPTTDGSTAQVLSNDEGDIIVLVEMDNEAYIFVTYYTNDEGTNQPEPVFSKREIEDAINGI